MQNVILYNIDNNDWIRLIIQYTVSTVLLDLKCYSRLCNHHTEYWHPYSLWVDEICISARLFPRRSYVPNSKSLAQIVLKICSIVCQKF